MTEQKYPYGSVWMSYSSLKDLKNCRRLYTLRNCRKINGYKVQVVNPNITLGELVHETINTQSHLTKEQRFSVPLANIFLNLWQDFKGKAGGFDTTSQEEDFKSRGIAILENIQANCAILKNPMIKPKDKDGLPTNYLLSEEDGLVLCGNIDWIEVLNDGSLHLIDFKTGKNDETDSLQLQIYCALISKKSKRPVSKISYWYVARETRPSKVEMPDMEGFEDFLIEKGKEMKTLRSQKEVVCAKGVCRHCAEYEKVFNSEAEFVGIDPIMNKARYYLNSTTGKQI